MNSAEEKELEFKALKEFILYLNRDTLPSTRVRCAINEELTERQRQMVYLYYYKNMTMNEIAESIGVSQSTVSRTINRGKGRIRKYLRYNGRYIVDTLDP